MAGKSWKAFATSTLALATFGAIGCGAKTVLSPYARVEDLPVVDAGLVIDAGREAVPLCIDVPTNGGPTDVALHLDAQVGRVDVVFLIDNTGSMFEELEAIRSRLRDRIAPAIHSAIPDSQLAVTTHGDFPAADYGLLGYDVPFALMSTATDDLVRVQAALDAVELGAGGDLPESQVEGLYQLATGEGLIDPRASSPTGWYVPPAMGCPNGGRGYACLRPDSVPVILLFTDTTMHEGPNPLDRHAYIRGALGFERTGIGPHTFEDAAERLSTLGAYVIGFDSDPRRKGTPDLSALALRTGAVDSAGEPLVYPIGYRGEGLSDSVVGAIQTFANTVVQDVDAVVRDVHPTDGIDAEQWVEYVEPVAADPMSGIDAIDTVNHRFVQVRVGTALGFRLVVRAAFATPSPEPRSVTLEVIFRGNGRTRIASQLVTLRVPAIGGPGCDAAPP